MGDDLLDRVPEYNRLSIRAVLVDEGDDEETALADAGLIDSVAIPVVLGEEPHPADGMLGNGITANLTAVLETEQEDDLEASDYGQATVARPASDAAQPPEVATTNLPAAFGGQPLAPVRRVYRS